MKNPPSEKAIVRQIVNRLHVSASEDEVEKEFRSKIVPKFRNSPEVDELVEEAKRHHRHNIEMYNGVMKGSF